jgi:hypothetical protein
MSDVIPPLARAVVAATPALRRAIAARAPWAYARPFASARAPAGAPIALVTDGDAATGADPPWRRAMRVNASLARRRNIARGRS